jgi:hypothetical protein
MKNIIKKVLGPNSRMISGSKSGYSKQFPKNVPVFNANLCTTEGKFWYGDIDLTTDKSKLVFLAKELDKDVYVLYEMDARFENEKKPKLDRAIMIFKKDGTFQLREDMITYIKITKQGEIKLKK